MKRIALVGGIGSGKSYAAKNFGYPVFNADDEVDKLYRTSKTCFKKINKALPNLVVSYPIKKNEMTNAIIKNDLNLKKIVKIIHPLIRKKMNLFLKKMQSRKFIILDIPLLLENKLNNKNDILIFVQSNRAKIYKRLKKRKNFNYGLFKKFKKIQLPLEVKKKKCKYILKNNFTKLSLKKNIREILKKIKND